ncbi:hypothetical protein PCE1_002900 [Barthelona sp. PCE]
MKFNERIQVLASVNPDFDLFDLWINTKLIGNCQSEKLFGISGCCVWALLLGQLSVYVQNSENSEFQRKVLILRGNGTFTDMFCSEYDNLVVITQQNQQCSKFHFVYYEHDDLYHCGWVSAAVKTVVFVGKKACMVGNTLYVTGTDSVFPVLEVPDWHSVHLHYRYFSPKPHVVVKYVRYLNEFSYKMTILSFNDDFSDFDMETVSIDVEKFLSNCEIVVVSASGEIL